MVTHNKLILPPIIELNDYGGDWSTYIEAVYQIFKRDFVDTKPVFRGIRCGLKRHPLIEGKEYTFYHMTHEGSDEQNRIPDLRRCERIGWPRPIIDLSTDSVLKVWKNKRGRKEYICIWYENEEYLVILAIRKGYLLPWTAYMVTRNHRKKKLQIEYNQYVNAKTAKDELDGFVTPFTHGK